MNTVLGDGLPIPARLIELMDRGFWPSTHAEELRQNIRCLASQSRIRLIAPEEDRIYFVRPPFSTVAKRMAGGESNFWTKFGALDGIAPELSILIGDFGLGSDSPILLDYRENRDNPVVIRLQWRKDMGQPNIWVRCADGFDEFAKALGLGDATPS
jgi:hypothetical protein